MIDQVPEPLLKTKLYISSSMHVIIATRVDPLIPLARTRSQREIVELRVQDFRFSMGEAKSFFNHVMELDLSPEDTRTCSLSRLTTAGNGSASGVSLALP